MTVRVEGRSLRLSNLDKVLYPSSGVTKGEILDYYTRAADVLLPHLRDRPLTRIRYPNGVDQPSFFEKNVPSHAPEWMRTVRLPAPGSSKDRDEIDYQVCDDLPSLVWTANLAAIELHVPQWTVDGHGRARGADRVVFDLDPGPPATLEQCCEVACLLREELDGDGLRGYPKVSGRKGMQVYVAVAPTDPGRVSEYAKALAVRLERRRRDLVVSRMAKSLRTGKVLIDWSQNNAAKTTVAPYSLRAGEEPTVSAPVTWEEVESVPQVPTLGEALDRIERHGDLFAPLRRPGPRLPS